jgi:Protein of unknown function (DUF979)
MVGHLPFEGNNPAQVLRRVLDRIYPTTERERLLVGKTWSQILDRALARKPEGRFADASSMRDAITAELSRLGFGSPRVELEAWFDVMAALGMLSGFCGTLMTPMAANFTSCLPPSSNCQTRTA